ncbi:uncharacterized protein METZ01_LOCUS496197 [marine metagenome]|uniref:Uncharacterized protein n=1 Tax=marine metagenome TaxID=408172 RepID=A0A383DGA1_9ZZZZ
MSFGEKFDFIANNYNLDSIGATVNYFVLVHYLIVKNYTLSTYCYIEEKLGGKSKCEGEKRS